MLSPAELQKLEHAFATDPSSEAYKPLAEAYLAMSRFMEAMVVCKKGVKAHPTLPDPRVLLARVYAEQGKDKKALEEIARGAADGPDGQECASPRRCAAAQGGGGGHRQGKPAQGLRPRSKDEETLALMSQHQVAAPVVVVPPPPPSPAPAAPGLRTARGRVGLRLRACLLPDSGSGRMPQALIQTEDRVPAPIARTLAAAGGTSPGPRPSQPRRERPRLTTATSRRRERPTSLASATLSGRFVDNGVGRPEKKSSLSRASSSSC